MENSVNEALRKDASQSAGVDYPAEYTGKSPIKVNKLGHMVYEVTDVERTAKFWRDVMGFEETDRNAIGMVFFRCGSDHHAIGLKPSKAQSRPKTGDALKIEHLALEVDSPDILLKTRKYLEENRIPVVFEGRKGAGGNMALHFCDPDGFEFELYCGMDQITEDGKLRPETQFHRVNTLEDALANPLPEKW